MLLPVLTLSLENYCDFSVIYHRLICYLLLLINLRTCFWVSPLPLPHFKSFWWSVVKASSLSGRCPISVFLEIALQQMLFYICLRLSRNFRRKALLSVDGYYYSDSLRSSFLTYLSLESQSRFLYYFSHFDLTILPLVFEKLQSIIKVEALFLFS